MLNNPFNSQSVGKHTLLLASFIMLMIALVFSKLTNYSNYVVVPIWVLWAGVMLSSKSVLPKNERAFIHVSIALLSLELVYWLIGYSSMGFRNVIGEVNWIMMGLVAIYAMSVFSEREMNVVYEVLIFLIVGILCIYAYMGRLILMVDMNEASDVANAWFGALFMTLSGLSVIVFMHIKLWFPRIVALIVLLLTLYINFYVLQRGINVIFTIAEIGLILVFVIKKKGLVFFLSFVIIVFAVFVITNDLLIDLFDWLAKVIPSERLARRFGEISTALYYEDINATSGSLSARSNLMGISWDTFSSSIGHFIFGAGEHYGENSIIGHHSFFIDTLARYGIIGGAIMFIYFKKQYQIIMSVLDKKREWALYMQCSVVFLFYVARNFYGVLANGVVNLFVLVLLPMTFQIIKYYNKKSQI